MKKIKYFIFIIVVIGLFFNCSRDNDSILNNIFSPGSIGSKGQSVLSLYNVSSSGKILSGDGCYHGVFLGSTQNSVFGIEFLPAFEEHAGKGVSIVMTYVAWGIYTGFPASECDEIIAHGSYPMITWEPWTYRDNDRKWENRDISSGKYDSYILTWANAVKSWGKPIFLRPMHEMNGNWYPWAINHNNNTYDSFITAWKYIVDKFNSVGAHNVTWVWCPNHSNDPESNDMVQCYPGDEYVDWIGMDGYNWGVTQSWSYWQSFRDVFDYAYNVLTSLSSKPLMIGEFACTEEGGSKADWITDAIGSQIKNNYPGIKAIVWFNINKECDWRVESSPQSQNAYKNAIADSYYLANDPKNPPPPPGPVISNVLASDITANSSVIKWNTDITADSTVEYGMTQSLGLSVYDSSLVTTHSITLSGLTKRTFYYYRVKSTANDKISVSSVYKFRTKNR